MQEGRTIRGGYMVKRVIEAFPLELGTMKRP
mgnify:FL=1